MDSSVASLELIEKLILPDFKYIRNDVTEVTTGMPLYHSILSAIAMGDGATQSTFRRAGVSKEVGEKAIEELCEIGIIRVDKAKAIFTSWEDVTPLSNRLYFTSPFLRFWFAFVSPIFKGIRDGDYKEIREEFTNRSHEFYAPIFRELSYELLKLNFQKEDAIVEIGEYWDATNLFDIYAKRASSGTIVGRVKYTNSKMNKSELTRLQESAKESGINADIFVLVSKTGFSKELKALKGANLRLITLKNFKKLVE